MNTFGNSIQTRSAAATGLSVVGFVALVAAGMWLAVYSTRYVPTVVNGAGAAAVYLGSVFNHSTATLSVVPTLVASSTISSTASSTTATSTVEKPAPAKSTTTVPGTETSATYPLEGTATQTPVTGGLPDFIVIVKDVGYLTVCTSQDSFVASSTVQVGNCPAIQFTIKNVGGDATSTWRFSASIPTQTAYVYQSQPQPILKQGWSVDYTLGFDYISANKGLQTFSVTANIPYTDTYGAITPAITELNPSNNSASAKITILGN